MPFPLLPVIAAGANLLGSGINSLSQVWANRQNERFSRQMYEQQKQDNLAFWNMQNQYNSPAAQMQRFKDAGLNPNLIYGQGSAGLAPSVQAPSSHGVNFRSPEFGSGLQQSGLGLLNSIYDLDIKKAQIDNLRAQNAVIREDALLRRNQTDTGRFKLSFEQSLQDISADARREELRKLQIGNKVAIEQNARDAATNASSLKEAAERMLTMQYQRVNTEMERSRIKSDVIRLRAESRRIEESIKGIQSDNTLKNLDIELRRQGINPHDPMWARVVSRLLAEYFAPDGAPNGGGSILDWIMRR